METEELPFFSPLCFLLRNVLLFIVDLLAGWSWSIWFSVCVFGLRCSVCCGWRHAYVHSHRYGSIVWRSCRGLLFEVCSSLLFVVTCWALIPACRFYTIVIMVDYSNRYGAIPLKAKYCHEMALRILLASIEVPTLSLPWFLYLERNLIIFTCPFLPMLPTFCFHLTISLFFKSLESWNGLLLIFLLFFRMISIILLCYDFSW